MLLGIVISLSVLASVGLTLRVCALEGLQLLWVMPVSFLGAFLAQIILIFLVILLSCTLVKNKPSPEKESKYFRAMVQLVCASAVPLLMIRVRKKGLEQAPKTGPIFLVCNHLHNIDPVFLLRSFPKMKLSFVAKQEAEKMFLIGTVLRQLRCQLINRENDREALKTILQCIKMLQGKEASIAVFPEGGIIGDELMHPFRNGVFKIPLKAQVPIVVCTMHGTHHALKNIRQLRPTEVELHLVKVLYPEDYRGMNATQIGNTVYELMARDLGSDKVWQKPENMEETE